MRYQETGFMRALKYLKPPIVPKFENIRADQNIDEKEILNDIKQKVLDILGKFENGNDVSFLKEEFSDIDFGENHHRIELASKLLFREALAQNGFRFTHYLDFIAGLRTQSLVTYRKFIQRLTELCDTEITALLWHEYVGDGSNSAQNLFNVFVMIDELFRREILSTKTIVDYIYFLLAAGSIDILICICTFLHKFGPELNSAISEAKLYINGMSKLGRKLNWFAEYKTLDSAYATLKNLSLQEDTPMAFVIRLMDLLSFRDNNWNLYNQNNGSGDPSSGIKPYHEQPESRTETASCSNHWKLNLRQGANDTSGDNSELAEYFGYLNFSVRNLVSAENLQSLRNNLNENINYFISWSGGYVINREKLDSMTKVLYEFIENPKCNNFELIFESGKEQMSNLQEAIAPLVEAFLNLTLGNLILAKNNVFWVEKLVQYVLKHSIFSEEHCSGLSYLCTLLRIDWNLEEETVTEEMARTLDSLDFDTLHSKGKSIVWVARWMLDQAINGRQRESLEYLVTVRDLDSENWYWNYLLYQMLKYQRRQQVAQTYNFTEPSRPGEVEFEAILNAVELTLTTPGNCHVMAVSGLCQALAEILRFRTVKKLDNEKVDIRTHVLLSNSSILNYIFTQVGNALEDEDEFEVSFAEYFQYGNIVSSILPYQDRNFDLAELCYLQCITIKPRSSKALHKIGAVHLFGRNDPEKAIVYFQRAVSVLPRNFEAWADLLQASLGKVRILDGADVGDMFSHVFGLNIWSDDQRSTLQFLYGCYHWLTGQKDAAIDLWVDHDKEGNVYKQLSSMQRRYGWPKNICFSLQDILQEIRVYSGKESQEKILQLKARILQAINLFQNQNQNRRRN